MKSLLSTLVMALLIASAGAVSAGETPVAQLLPDLRPLQPADLDVVRHDKQVWIKFATDVLNKGAGPLEMKPVVADCDGDEDPTNDRLAMQQLFEDTNGSGKFERVSDDSQEVPAGCQHFHPEHNHWHFDDFGVYKLLKIKSDGTLRRPAVARADKVTFCMVDTFGVRSELPGYIPVRYYPRKPNDDAAPDCLEDTTTGISIGWADRYGADLPGQELPITGLSDGFYCLRVRTDPLDRIDESSDENNRNSLRVHLEEIDTAPGMRYEIPKDARCPK